MSVTTKQKEIKRLRSYLNPYIKGPTTDAILDALSGPSSYLINNAAAVNDQLYIVTASGRYLDERLSEAGITRPPAVGLSDDVFRQIGIEVKNRKQVRDLINNLLDAIFGDEFVRASSSSSALETYNLQDGDTLIINFDEKNTVTVTFKTSEFQNIAAATAQEVADAITKNIRALGFTGTAIAKNDGNGPYVVLFSDSIGPSSSVTVLGGRAQNKLIFDSPVAAGGNMSTQWTISIQPSGLLRYTWSGGANPQLGKVNAGNYVNIYGGGFGSSSNEGSYTIVNSVGGPVNASYFEISNPLGLSGIIVQGIDDAVLFFNPIKKTVTSRISYAAVFQTQPRILQIFLPAATKVVRRGREGSAHLHDPSDPVSLLPNQPGPYCYDLSKPYTIGEIGTTLTQNVDSNSSKLISVSNSSQFPDSQGYIVLGYGSESEEGPIPYIARPSNSTLLISPVYTIKNTHNSGSDVSFVSSKAPVSLSLTGSDFEFFITDVVAGRVYAQDLIQSIAAAGITVVYTILLPDDTGLGKWSTQYSENSQIWGP